MSGHDSNSPEPTRIDAILEHLKLHTDLKGHLEIARIVEEWPEIVGPALAPHTAPRSLRESLLTIEAESAVWLHRLSYDKSDILNKVNAILSESPVTEIFATLAEEEDEDAPQDGA